ncbi:MAG: Mrp/NBP35 family ATP-binding protein [Verrucomicrobiae bacterium]|nr:Mrp/NBP35 family ATP-binding protein [Verrucomicrobiae bacterium]
MLTQDDVLKALKAVKYPGYSRDIVSFGLVKHLQVTPEAVAVHLEMTSARPDVAAQLKADCERVLQQLPGIRTVAVDVRMAGGGGTGAPANPWAGQARVPGIERIVAVASGKGGVGKSTCSANLACALQREGLRVGLLDCDIYGPTIPLMMGTRQRPTITPDEKLLPPAAHGVKLMSIGFLLDDDQPVIWRGPMIVKTIQQFLVQVEWGTLDYLIVDLPPGTGDAQLTLCQTVPLDGGVVVTTPQEASLGVVRKGIAMFDKVHVPVLGLIENMSYFLAPDGRRLEIFGHGGGRQEAQRKGLPFLGEIPIFIEIREGGDQGIPVVVGRPGTAAAQAFIAVARAIHAQVEQRRQAAAG